MLTGPGRPRLHASLCTIDRPLPVAPHPVSTIPSPRPRQRGPSPRLLHDRITISIDAEWATSSPHVRFVMYHRPSTTCVRHAVLTSAARPPRQPGPSPRLPRNCITTGIDGQWSFMSPRADLVLLHRSSTARCPPSGIHPCYSQCSSPWTVATAVARAYMDIYWLTMGNSIPTCQRPSGPSTVDQQGSTMPSRLLRERKATLYPSNAGGGTLRTCVVLLLFLYHHPCVQNVTSGLAGSSIRMTGTSSAAKRSFLASIAPLLATKLAHAVAGKRATMSCTLVVVTEDRPLYGLSLTPIDPYHFL
jgi:hypothetical protein